MNGTISSSGPDIDYDDLMGRLDHMNQTAPPLDDFEKTLANGVLGRRLGLRREDISMCLIAAGKKMRRGEFLVAFRLYLALVVLDPKNPAFHMAIANCGLEIEQYDFALRSATAAIALAPADARGYYLAGRANLSLKRRENALTDLRMALARARAAKQTQLEATIASLLGKAEVLASL